MLAVGDMVLASHEEIRKIQISATDLENVQRTDGRLQEMVFKRLSFLGKAPEKSVWNVREGKLK